MASNPKDFNTPTFFTIFGATGDLSKKKLFPALCSLYSEGYMPDECYILGFAKSDISSEEFRDLIKEAITSESSNLTKEDIDEFLERAYFIPGLFDDISDYRELKSKIQDLEDGLGVCANKLFYLAAPQDFYEIIFKNLSESGFMEPCSDEEGWARILVEKPFGSDLEGAKKLEDVLSDLFDEQQIFRIDHYLDKEAIQNILAFRFSNTLFDSRWDKGGVEKVEVKMLESFGVENRGSFYDDAGALRDVGQNHVLQMMAMVGMENPGSMKAKDIRTARADFFDKLQPIKKKDLESRAVLGQYSGYKEINGVDSGSDTETYFRIKAFVKNKRWKGVPFYMESGKKLDRTETKISVHFKPCKGCLCPPESKCGGHRNVLTFSIKPEQSIDVRFWAKKPGFGMELEPKELSFSLSSGGLKEHIHEAYERVLFNCITGDQTSFVSSKEEVETWEFIMSVLSNKEELEIKTYEPGSRGPDSDF